MLEACTPVIVSDSSYMDISTGGYLRGLEFTQLSISILGREGKLEKVCAVFVRGSSLTGECAQVRM